MRAAGIDRTRLLLVVGASAAGAFATGPRYSLIVLLFGVPGLFVAARVHRNEAGLAALPAALAIGVAIGVGFIALEGMVFWNGLPASLREAAALPLGRRLAFFAIAACQDELVWRLFGVSLLVLLFARLRAEAAPSAATFVAAIVASAGLYVLVHLPVLTARAPLTPFLALRELALHFTTPVAWGLVYWRRGLAAAMAAHAASHLPVQLGLSLLPA